MQVWDAVKVKLTVDKFAGMAGSVQGVKGNEPDQVITVKLDLLPDTVDFPINDLLVL